MDPVLTRAGKRKTTRHSASSRRKASVNQRTKNCNATAKQYASFSSLIWIRVSWKAHTWRWKDHLVWGVGCSDTDIKQQHCDGGIWYTTVDTCEYKNWQSAQAAVETYELCAFPPEFLMDDVDLVWDCLSQAQTFEGLQSRTELSAGRLSDALARCYELQLLQMSLITGAVTYLRSTKRAR